MNFNTTTIDAAGFGAEFYTKKSAHAELNSETWTGDAFLKVKSRLEGGFIGLNLAYAAVILSSPAMVIAA
ncbi:hypothetical protein K0J45_04245 [Shewanella alkalitolerans]|uniref:hypothetical protein n=1 Tax=Shewanella alkalitolerans TaxID=2864209 RepID=UPI001C654FBB|nr:hypothetical protein [Shewanella alkalitolerans]QYJ98458.1 hypothetical protein K0J45_04245 [Shewanella alkalitolerans]